MLILQKKIILFSLFIPRFFIRKFITVAELFLRAGELTKTNVRWGWGRTCKTNRDEQEEGGQKLEFSSERTFWMTPMASDIYMAQGFQEWTKQNLLKTTFKKFEVIWFAWWHQS